MKKQCQIVRLPHPEGVFTFVKQEYEDLLPGDLIFTIGDYYDYSTISSPALERQDIYLVSNDSIQVGDKCIVDFTVGTDDPKRWRKILGSTDYSLGLPLLTTPFLESYLQEKGLVDEVIMHFAERYSPKDTFITMPCLITQERYTLKQAIAAFKETVSGTTEQLIQTFKQNLFDVQNSDSE